MASKPKPHLEAITDWPTKQTISLLWDEIHAMRDQVTAAHTALRTAQGTITDLQAQQATTHALAQQASLAVGQAVTVLGTTQGTPPGPAPDNPPPAEAATAPDMLATVQAIVAQPQWQLDNGDAFDQADPLGRGGCIEAIVTALHAIDAHWGHIHKNPGQKQYNTHAIDAIMWARPDGTAGEIYDVLSGTPPTQAQWVFDSATPANLTLWYY